MENSLAELNKLSGNKHVIKPTMEHHFSHKRIGSGDSTLSTASTRCPEGMDFYDGLQGNKELCMEMPMEATWVSRTQQQGNIIKGLPSVAWSRHLVSCTTRARRIESPPAIGRTGASSSPTGIRASTPQILGHAKPTRIGMAYDRAALARAPPRFGESESIWTRSPPPPPLRQWLSGRGSIQRCVK